MPTYRVACFATASFARLPESTTVTAFGSNFSSLTTDKISAYVASTWSSAAYVSPAAVFTSTSR
jgi:hypothetical protein